MATATHIYAGRHDDMVAEVAAFDFKSIGVTAKNCKYTVLPVGDAQWDTEYAANLVEARALVLELAAAYPNAKICWL